MLASYFTIAFRNLLKNKVYSFINIFGLALGLACVFLILQYLKTELSYDRFHDQAENVYRIVWDGDNPQTRVPHPIAQAMVRDFPEVESAVSLSPIWGPGLTQQTFSIRNLQKDIKYDELNVLSVDSTFFDVFSFPLISGNPRTALSKPMGMLLSESMAKKYFGDENALGKQLAVNDDQQLVEITGVFKDVPVTSHFHFDFLLSYVTLKRGNTGDYYTWKDFGHFNYIRLKPEADSKLLESKMLDWSNKYIEWSAEDLRHLKENGYGFQLQPITDIHLRSSLRWELESNGNIDYIYMMTAAALLILIIAGVNFVNLTTALSSERAKEIGIRKTLGAFRKQLAFQFVGEAMLVALFAMVIAGIMIEASLSFINVFTGSPIVINYEDLIPMLAGLSLLVGLVAGIYPSLYLSSIKPGQMLKGKFLQNPGGVRIRQTFMVFQFIASMVLISSSVIIYNQLGFIQHKSLGFNQEELIVIPVKNRKEMNPKISELRTELLSIPGVASVSATSNIPGRSFNQNGIFTPDHPDEDIDASEVYVDYDFFKTLSIEFTDGKTFSLENPADRDAFIINETAMNSLHMKTGVGEEIVWNGDGEKTRGKVIGVVKDFNFQSLHRPIGPLIFRLSTHFNYVVVRVRTDEFPATIASIGQAWKKFDDDFTFEFTFLKEQLDQQYRSEQNMGNVLASFSLIAVVIACFGLLGIAALSFRQKTKEISVRKVLGASLMGLIVLLMRDFTRLIGLSIVLAAPLTWWMMSRWLEKFSFRTEINPLVFVGAGGVLILIAWGTLAYLTLKIAKLNPAETLKSE
ncbi:MAG: FtsX-like permease family protein [Cyclobacteriaceae bacterium]|nr:FtsX-like permease family protein [Cyclobacteriaceae bacterium]